MKADGARGIGHRQQQGGFVPRELTSEYHCLKRLFPLALSPQNPVFRLLMNDNKRHRLRTRLNLVAAAALVALGLLSKCSADEVRPNLLFIIADQHCADVMSCAGNSFVETPALDRLARHGVRFTRAYVTHPLCIPSRASFMTGRMPSQCRDDVPSHKSLGASLQAAG